MELKLIYIIFILIITIIVFLLSVKEFSKETERLFGNKFKNLLEKFTNSTTKGVLAGIGVTSIIQSSTAVAIMLVSLADAGLIGLKNSLGVIIGSNIGTTITAQIMAFNIFKIAPYVLMFGFVLSIIKNKHNKLQRFGKSIFYFGLMFTCLLVISMISGEFKESSTITFFLEKSSNLYIAIIMGIIISTILQSSSVTTGLVIAFASGGLLAFGQAFGIILGSNIGTTGTSLVASLMTNINGKRVAMAHFIFNFIGVVIFLPFIKIFSQIIQSIPVSLTWQVAISHLSFNLIIGIIFMLLIKPYEKLVIRIIK
jgi:phosphate:Na+ symporter